MRIAFFSDNAYPELSGVADSMLMTGKMLVARGHEVCCVAPRYAALDYARASRARPNAEVEDTIDGVRFVRLPSVRLPASPTGQSRLAFPTGASFPFLDAFKPDVIHTHSPYGAGLKALRAAKRFGVPLVGTNHTLIEMFYPRGMRGLMRRYEAWYYDHCCFVTAPYEGLISRMRESGFVREARAEANPVELDLFSVPAASEKEARKREFGAEGPVVLFVGRLSADKRVDAILRGVQALSAAFPNLTFLITGHGVDEPRLRSLTRSLGIEHHVRFTGFLSGAALVRAYQAADVFALLSVSDSQSISLMQAYASGVPAVCARAGGLPDYTPSDCGYLVEPDDTKAFAARVQELLSDDALRARMGAAASKFVARFAPEAIAADWEAMYANALETTSRAPLPSLPASGAAGA
jgi:glycosyltransferase involved in cell wall biosynthesis